MKVRFLGTTTPIYRSASTKPPVRLIQVSRGAIIDLPDEKVQQLRRDFPTDWEIITPATVSEPVAAQPTPKEMQRPWTRKKPQMK